MFTGTLFPKQVPAAEFLCNKKKALLGWEQGCGKTIISLAATEKLVELGKVKNVLVITLPSITWQWADRIEEFTTCRASLVTRENKKSRLYGQKRRYTVVSYNLFRRDLATIAKRDWDLVICDEAQLFSGWKSVTLKKVRSLNRQVRPKYRWALTGTAISNKLEELWNIFSWIDSSFLPIWPAFEKQHIVRDHFGAITTYTNLDELHTYLKNRMDRKTESDLDGSMPSIRTKVHKLAQTKEYKKNEKKLFDILNRLVFDLEFDKEGNPKTPKEDKSGVIRKAFHGVRQELYATNKLDYITERIERILDESPRNKYVLFSERKGPIYSLQERLGIKGIQSALFTGDQTASEKRESVNRLAGSTRVLICSAAGDTGLDLPYANYVGNVDTPFSYGKSDQRKKRCARASSKFKSIVVDYFIVEDSIEDFFYQVVLKKEELAKAVTEGTADEVVVREESLRQFIKSKREDD